MPTSVASRMSQESKRRYKLPLLGDCEHNTCNGLARKNYPRSCSSSDILANFPSMSGILKLPTYSMTQVPQWCRINSHKVAQRLNDMLRRMSNTHLKASQSRKQGCDKNLHGWFTVGEKKFIRDSFSLRSGGKIRGPRVFKRTMMIK
jgi:hypothetical protein